MDKISVWEFDGHLPQMEPLGPNQKLTDVYSRDLLEKYLKALTPSEASKDLQESEK